MSNKFSIKQQQQQPQQQQQQTQQSKSTNNKNSILNSNSNSVKFIDFHPTEKIDEREKYLTAKYPNHQMALIKKRLKVEFWIDDRLKYLYDIDVRVFFFFNICSLKIFMFFNRLTRLLMTKIIKYAQMI
jgi:hypothetical protein